MWEILATIQDQVDDINGDTKLQYSLGDILNGIIFALGIVAVIVMIIGGISITMSQGDPNKVKKGKDTILYGAIGLMITVSAWAIVNFILNIF